MNDDRRGVGRTVPALKAFPMGAAYPVAKPSPFATPDRVRRRGYSAYWSDCKLRPSGTRLFVSNETSWDWRLTSVFTNIDRRWALAVL